MPSNKKVPNSTRRISRTMPERPSIFSDVLISSRSRREMRRRSSREKAVAMVIKPRPPVWISSRMTVQPKGLQYR